jgi:23S rRNA (guanosine2251-2'-O)-methyltransferase
MSKQLTHNEVEQVQSNKEIIVVAENIRTPENVGMIFRVSEAFGVKKVILIGDNIELNNRKIIRTARNTDKELTIQTEETTQSIIADLKTNGYSLLGLEITDSSKLLQNFNFSEHKKIALFIGAERYGISEDTLQNLEDTLHFNLFGKNSSVNVVNALTVGLYEITRY